MAIQQTQPNTATAKECACNVYSERLRITAQDGEEFSVRHMRLFAENTTQVRCGAFRVYDRESRDIGFLKYTCTYGAREGVCMHLNGMYFENPYRSRGLGTAVLGLLQTRAELDGVRRIEGELQVPAEAATRTSTRILAFYKKNGFQITEDGCFYKISN